MNFEDDLEDALNEKGPRSWRRWGTSNLVRHVSEISRLDETRSGTWSVLTESLYNIWLTEKSKADRIKEFNRRRQK